MKSQDMFFQIENSNMDHKKNSNTAEYNELYSTIQALYMKQKSVPTCNKNYDYISVMQNRQDQNSLTKNAKQRYWSTPTEFPLCPLEIRNEPLRNYLDNLEIGSVVSKNRNTTHIVDEAGISNDKLFIRTHDASLNNIKNYSLITVTYEDGYYIHSGTLYFSEIGACKAITTALGRIWDGEECIDDYC